MGDRRWPAAKRPTTTRPASSPSWATIPARCWDRPRGTAGRLLLLVAEVPPPRDLPAAAYVAAFVAYVALGYVFKSAILNWVVGPLFLLVVLHLLPRALTRRPVNQDNPHPEEHG